MMNDGIAAARLADLLAVSAALQAGAAELQAGVADAAFGAEALIETRLPWLVADIRADAEEGRFARWSLSTVVDEFTGEAVLDRATFEALHRIAGLGGVDDGAADADGDAARRDVVWPVGNAGLLHVYGYLLSTAATPWGAKRDRWVGGDVARAFGEDPAFLTPWHWAGVVHPGAGPTMLARVERLVLAALAGEVAGSAVRFVRDEPVVSGRDSDRVDDSVDDAGERAARDVMRTVVVSRPGAAHAALVYGRVSSVEAASDAAAAGAADVTAVSSGSGRASVRVSIRPITVFPIAVPDDAAIEALFAAESRLRYNAAFPDLAPMTQLAVDRP
ncbi:hypothetical protein ACL9RL_15975 [Plantibacter sp. Mn2098]|uniref:hypothetical protein n=1 Tax=Plantibacter sp. Mn2098 TaxID=3395266 RepID=UPI003BDFD643